MALKGALELDLFTHIAEGALTSAEIARRSKASERGMRILCDFLTVIGFLQKSKGVYGLTPVAATFLDRNSPAYFGTVANFIASPEMLGRFLDVASLVRDGGAGEHYSLLQPEHERWVGFAQTMKPVVGMAAQLVAPIVCRPGRQQKVLDIAAGSGIFGITIARQNPLAEIVALDWPNVLEVSQENAALAGVQGRYQTIAGDAFQVDLGSGYDLVLVPNFLHHFDEATVIPFLKRVHAALRPGGTIAAVEFVPNEDRVSPPIPAMFSLMMLGTTEAGEAYTLAELNRMFRAAGFGPTERLDLQPTPLTLIAATA